MTTTVQVGIKKVPVKKVEDAYPPMAMSDVTHTEEMMVHFFCGDESYCVHQSVSVGLIDMCRVGLSNILKNTVSSCRNNPLLARFLSELQLFLNRIQQQDDDIRLLFLAGEKKILVIIPRSKSESLFKEAAETVRHIKHIRQGKYFCLSSAGVTVACALLIGCLAVINADFLTHCLTGPILVSVFLAAGIACAITGAVMWKRSLDAYQLFAEAPEAKKGTRPSVDSEKVVARKGSAVVV